VEKQQREALETARHWQEGLQRKAHEWALMPMSVRLRASVSPIPSWTDGLEDHYESSSSNVD
jgi:hypothetical protein